MINLITNEDYFAIYSFTDSVSSLIGVKEYLKNQFPKEGNNGYSLFSNLSKLWHPVLIPLNRMLKII